MSTSRCRCWIPAIPRAVRLVRGEGNAGLLLVLAWALLPFALYTASGTQSSRYIFPTFVPLAVLAGAWLQDRAPRFARALRARWCPGIALLAALLFWVAPRTLSAEGNQPLKEHRAAIRDLVPAAEPLAFYGRRYWVSANPLMYYAERYLDPTATTLEESLRHARASRSRLLFCEADRLPEVLAAVPGLEVVIASGRWALVRVP